MIFTGAGHYSNRPPCRFFREVPMSEPTAGDHRSATKGDPNRARDHLANERTFLAWVRTGVAIVVFGFAIGRFAVAMRQVAESQGSASRTPELSVWFGTMAIVAGVVLTLAGLLRFRRTRTQLESGAFEPAGFVIDLVGVLTAIFGLALAGYLIYIELQR
jgi:putative membrane protein